MSVHADLDLLEGYIPDLTLGLDDTTVSDSYEQPINDHSGDAEAARVAEALELAHDDEQELRAAIARIQVDTDALDGTRDLLEEAAARVEASARSRAIEEELEDGEVVEEDDDASAAARALQGLSTNDTSLHVHAPTLCDRRLQSLMGSVDALTPTSTTPKTGSHSPPQVSTKVSQRKKTTHMLVEMIEVMGVGGSPQQRENSAGSGDEQENTSLASTPPPPTPPPPPQTPPPPLPPPPATGAFVRYIDPEAVQIYRLHGQSELRLFHISGFDDPADRAYYRKHGIPEKASRNRSDEGEVRRRGRPRTERMDGKVWIRCYEVTYVQGLQRGYEPLRRIKALWPLAYQMHREFMKRVKANEIEDSDQGWSSFMRPRRGRATAAANETGTCLIEAIKVSCQLLGEPRCAAADRIDYVRDSVFGGTFPAEGFTRVGLNQIIGGLNFKGRERLEPILAIETRRANRVRGHVGGMFHIDLEDGVYIALGVGHIPGAPGHAFALRVQDGVRHIYDPAEYDGPMAWHTNNLAWIRRWQYILRVTVRETYTVKHRKGRNKNRKKHRPERRRNKWKMKQQETEEGTAEISDENDVGVMQDLDDSD